MLTYMGQFRFGETIIKSLLLSIICSNALAQSSEIDRYNVIWTTQSKNSGESMPCGGGDIGLNVWVENGDVLFYMARSGTFDENNQMLKPGRMRLRLSPNPFTANDFKQELRLSEGSVRISAGGTVLDIWVDVFRPVIHVAIKSAQPTQLNAFYESWRIDDHVVTGTELRANSYKAPQTFEVKTLKDEVAFQGNEILFYHKNRADQENIFDFTVRKEQMEAVKDQLFNPVKNNTFGGIVRGRNLRAAGNAEGVYASSKFRAWKLESMKNARSHEIEIGLHVAQSETLVEWKAGLAAVFRDADLNKKTALVKTQAWWKQFWDRSYITIEGKDNTISRNYQLFRYQLACNAFGKWPTKFNGGLFAFDPEYVDKKYSYSPDFLLWGGGTFTAQNQRLVYFPMCKNGDFDLLKPQFDFYLNNLRNAELRSEHYWKHKGASFTEQIENFGLPNVTEYGMKRPAGYDPGMEHNAWLEYQWETVFEFCLMMLETERYEGRDISAYIPFIESCLTFYDEHYQMLARQRGAKTLDENGHYILYPTTAAETFKMTYNSTTVISALKVILERLLALPEKYLEKPQREQWSTMLKKVPPIPFAEFEGHKTLAPALAWARVQNSETPQLYPVFPWGIYGVGKPGLEIAINTYKYDPHAVKFRSHVGWRQYSIFAARLGLTEEAAALTREKFKDSNHRFPTFWGPGFDWTPDHNWGGSAMIGLQEMLLQTDDRKLFLLPAWPKEWNGKFKLHAPYQTILEGDIKDGKVENLKVTPASRAADVTILPL
ncbi:hypothetical protein DYBT9623_01692 [Dyadobacter sp. CECT 9623]|uniref:DUF5703 domain-containing protein n=1 Tax=Dyadobacter linearis TaxID=2823330 RepID=A0ABM8UN71_9BACT|nr:DUF5703 domain-containing protein [Dyadobacter sp. CECT 9623]CAG5068959.1 hypothetical protein DYBT9623_01692 [Dyadobacter sp. CECT 9623]